METATLVSLDEYFDLPDQPGVVYELLGGRLIEMGGPSFLHAAVQANVGLECGVIVRDFFPNLICGGPTPFKVDAESVQIPDYLVIDRGRQRDMERYRGALGGAPDLAVEIISPSEAAEDVDEKVARYLAAGAKTIWTIWPKTRHVLIHHANGEIRKAELDDFLDAPAIIPSAKIPVARIFPKL
jgi:Uma2 family endonuclease